MAAKAILFDSTQCVGCRACEEACSRKWAIDYGEAVASEERISERKLTAVVTHGERYARRLCMHCLEPACVSACPVGAFRKTPLGPVIYEEARCMGCRYCMLACPFGAPVYEWSKVLPKVRKCDMCPERLLEGKPTACSEACPAGATATGDRDQMIVEAKRRLAESPKQYDGRVYGLNDVGGTSVLMISEVPLGEFGLKWSLPQEPLPALTGRALAFVPDVVGVGAVLLGGVYWITHRREAVAAAEGAPRGGNKVERE